MKSETEKAFVLGSCIVLVLALFGFMGPSRAHALGHYGIPGTYLGGCDVCHDFINGVYEPDVVGTANLRWVRSTIEWPAGSFLTGVTYTKTSDLPLPADGTLADGDNSDLDGPCEVCHTATTYHNRLGDALNPRHYAGEHCTTCHPHFQEGVDNYFQATFVGPQSHNTHLTDLKGPLFDSQYGDDACIQCHKAGEFNLFIDDQPKATTTVCDPCHSPGGAYDGSAAAKAKWDDGVYEETGTDLQAGNDNWCVTCHDDGVSTIYGVHAPSVSGNNSSWGYNATGHGNYGVGCADCHDLAGSHTDGLARTYSADAVPNNYQSGYRLSTAMAVPRNGETHPVAFRLCTECHLYTDITGDQSNFRDDGKGQQYHEMHLNWWPAWIAADSDFDGVDCAIGACVDSAMTCVNCHNVHGPPNPAMIRHGELMSTPGTSDKVPALDFYWLAADGTTQTVIRDESRYGSLVCGLQPDASANGVCFGCHTSSRLTWFRNPAGAYGVTLDAVWTTDTNDVTKTQFDINPAERFRVRVRFTLAGASGPYFVQFANSAVGNSSSMSGPDWSYSLNKQGNAGSGSYEVYWEGPIPATAGDNAPAKVLMRIYVFDAQGGTLLDQDEMTWDFSTADLP